MQFVDVVVGGQYGSEAKGHVTAQLIRQAVRANHQQEAGARIINVRVAGPNAGHTAYDDQGQKFAFRTLPIGAIVDAGVDLYIAPGSEIDLDVLYGEIAVAAAHGHSVAGRLYVSRQATLLEQKHKDYEAELALVGKIGSTGKGIGAARADRILRAARTLGQWAEQYDEGDQAYPWEWAEPEDLYADDDLVHDANQHVIIEGTQGYALSMRASGHYPQVTSSDCRAIDFLAMAGLDPLRCSVKVTTWVVARVYPIRVAGNSGPMAGETTWEDLGLEPEKTTVTQKVRRVGAWDPELVRRAVQANGGHNAKVIITMIDQVIPEMAKFDTRDDERFAVADSPVLTEVERWIDQNASEEQIGAKVAGITYSPTQILWTDYANVEA